MDEKRVKEKKIIAFVIPSVLYIFSSLPSNESKKKKCRKNKGQEFGQKWIMNAAKILDNDKTIRFIHSSSSSFFKKCKSFVVVIFSMVVCRPRRIPIKSDTQPMKTQTHTLILLQYFLVSFCFFFVFFVFFPFSFLFFFLFSIYANYFLTFFFLKFSVIYKKKKKEKQYR